MLRISDGLDGERGASLAWAPGHLAFCSALVLFVVVVRWLRGLPPAGGRVEAGTHWTATAGAAALMVQLGIDMVARGGVREPPVRPAARVGDMEVGVWPPPRAAGAQRACEVVSLQDTLSKVFLKQAILEMV